MIQVIFRTLLIKLFLSINSTQAFYLSKVSWKFRSFFRFNPYQNLTWKKKFKIMILKRQLLRTLSHLNIKSKNIKNIKNNSTETLQNLFSQCPIIGVFPDNLKLSGISPVFEKKDPLNKENYRPVSVLLSISEIFEKLMQKQINVYAAIGKVLVHI